MESGRPPGRNIARPARASISPCKPLGNVVVPAGPGTPPATVLNCLSPTPWGRVALCNPPKARWIRELWAPIPRPALSRGHSTSSSFVAESSPTLLTGVAIRSQNGLLRYRDIAISPLMKALIRMGPSEV